ncbi:HNH endonuclease [Streptosporangium sp. NPDC023825]|uniref:HNH endonuclease n=1 Tax=Streptosporangium sp. NPDC023825 TaxID=3154909 RepID=UPI0034289F74
MKSPKWSRDELILACALVEENDWNELRVGDPRVVELSGILRDMPIHDPSVRGEEFRSQGSVSRKSTDIATWHPGYKGSRTKGGKLDREVIAEFLEHPDEMRAAARAIRESVLSGDLENLSPVEEEFSAMEGQLLVRLHVARERSRGLRERKISAVLGSGQSLECQICNFGFEETYGELGKGYIEVHHRLPLHASGKTRTALEDLILLCANCHRMCHRKHPQGRSWLTPEELRLTMRSAAKDRHLSE